MRSERVYCRDSSFPSMHKSICTTSIGVVGLPFGLVFPVSAHFPPSFAACALSKLRVLGNLSPGLVLWHV